MPTRHASRPDDPTLSAHLLDPRHIGVVDLDRWRTLADRAAEPNPYFRMEYVLANVYERDVDARLMVVSEDDRWIACLPVVHRGPSRVLPLPHMAALTDEYSLLGTPLIDRDRVPVAADALVGAMHARWGAAAVLIDLLGLDGPVGPAMLRAAERRGLRPIALRRFERAAWRKVEDEAAPGQPGKGTDVARLRRRARRLAKDLGGVVQLADRTNAQDAPEAFLAMENSGWKAEQGTALGSTPEDAAFFRRICKDMAAVGLLRLMALEVDGRAVAMECHLRDGDAQFSFKIAYDHELSAYSPGAQLDLQLFEGFGAQGLTVVDTCSSPSNAHMNRLWPHRRQMQTLLLPTGSRSSVLVRPFVAGKAFARSLRADLVKLRRGGVDGVWSAAFAAVVTTWESAAGLV